MGKIEYRTTGTTVRNRPALIHFDIGDDLMPAEVIKRWGS